MISRFTFVFMAVLSILVLGVTPGAPGSRIVTIPDGDNTCMTRECHGSLKEQRFLHAPVLQEDCSQCHMVREAGLEGLEVMASEVHEGLVTVRPDRDSCGECHAFDRKPEAHAVHEPFGGRCDVCHDPHGGNHRLFLAAADPEALCSSCHEDMVGKHEYIHGPIVLGLCLECHTGHTSEFDGLLKAPPEELCFSCHVDVKRRFDANPFHHAATDAGCMDCHHPHGSEHRFFLPAQADDLCLTCHGDALATREELAFPHEVMVKGRRCSSCHDPHSSAHGGLLTRSSLEICSGCHDAAVSTARGTTLKPVGQWVKDQEYLHGPIRDGDCSACHSVHGSNEPGLLKGAFPAGFYAAYHEGVYGLCFECHDARLAEEEFTERTGFRNGTRNLHFVHVNKERGRSCRVCHETHASGTPFHIRDSVEFGRWEMSINFTETGTGGYCQDGCHGRREYERYLPADDEQ